MAISLRKAEFDLNNFGKHLDESDPTIANHVALLLTILSGRSNMPYLGILQDKNLEAKRMAELDEIYARGGRPPLAEKFSNEKKNVKKHYTRSRAVKMTNKATGEILEFQSIKEAARYLNRIEPSKTVSGYENLLHLKTKYKNYTFEIEGIRVKPSKDKRKPVIAKNLKTGETIEFESLSSCSNYLKTVCKCKVYREKLERILEKDMMIENWKIRYKEGN
ncbi:MAG: NUMOD1 domain-containing DNA-binding protein [Intestinibacter sp.]|uniref:NUMOD1 domain-containing DNA-binding protein n=1 Tax=Intestinibacter sp. TaxID=1965304 RepID=UPI003F163A3B